MDVEMLKLVLDEIRAVRHSLEQHVATEDKQYAKLQDQISKMREDVAEHKTRLGMITAGIAIFVTSVVSYLWQVLTGRT